MTRLTDEELERQLDRRLGAAQLDPATRHGLMTTLSERVRQHPRQRVVFTWRAARWLAAATAVVAVMLVASLILPPRTATPGPSPTAPPSIRVLAEPELAALVRSGTSVGQVVVASAQILVVVCGVPEACPRGDSGALSGDLSIHVTDVGEVRPSGPLAFLITTATSLRYLGPVALNGQDLIWTVAELTGLALADDTASDVLYPITGWLVEAGPISCPAPPEVFDDDPTNNDLRWYCRTGWLEPEPAYTEARSGNSVSGLPLPAGSLLLQAGAYQEFAPDPQFGDRGPEPRYGAYLVRAAGCPVKLGGDCPVWEMVGRLDPTSDSVPVATNSQAPSASPPATPTASAAAKGRVFCGRLSADECLRTIRQANVTPLPDGWAVVVESSCGPGEWCDWIPASYVVLVPPDWEEAGGLQITTVQLDLGDATRNDQLNLRPHIREMLPTDGPWTDPSVGDHVWVAYSDIGWEGVTAFVERHGLDGVNDQLNRAQPVGWFEIRTRDDTDPAALRDELLADPVICRAERVRFDEQLNLVLPPAVAGCTDRPAATIPPSTASDPLAWAALTWADRSDATFAGDGPVRLTDLIPWGDGFMAVGYEGSLYDETPPTARLWLSTDGIAWQRITAEGDEFDAMAPVGLHRTASGVVAWDSPAANLLFSVDGRHWTRTGEFPNPLWATESLAESVLIGWSLVAPEGEGHSIWRLRDGLWWDGQPTEGLDGVLISFIADTRVGMFIVNAQDSRGNNASYRSTDGGRTWSSARLPNGFGISSITVRPDRIYAAETLCQLSTDCVGPAFWRPRMWWTTDGENWTLADNEGHPDIGYYDDRYVIDLPNALRDGEPLRISEDGETWHEIGNVLPGPQTAPDSADGYRFVVGSNGIVLFSVSPKLPQPVLWFGEAAASAGSVEVAGKP